MRFIVAVRCLVKRIKQEREELYMKKALSLLLCLLLLLCPLMVACEGGGDAGDNGGSKPSGTTSGTGEGSLYKDSKGLYTLDNLGMPAFDFDATEFRVCVYNNVVQGTYFSEEIECDDYATTDNQLKDGVNNRNNRIYEKYGVVVKAYAVDDVAATVREDVSANTNQFDAAMPFMFSAVSMAQDGMLFDLHEFGDYIHLDAPWWDQKANESLSISNRLYFTTGDISIMQKIVSNTVLFNRSMYEQNLAGTYGDMYDLVRDHKWTLDTMHEMGRAVTAELNGESGMQYEDQWGMVGANGALGYYVGGGYSLVDKSVDDIPQIAIGRDEASLSYAQKVLQTFEADDWFFNTQSPSPTTIGNLSLWETAMAAFGDGRSLFYTAAFSAVKKLRNYEASDYMGFLPLPLSDQTQDNYCTYANISYAYGVCIPLTVPNPQFSAYMLEALACYAKDDITPAYYNSTLLDRDAQTDNNVDMLENYIFNNVVYDPGILYGLGGLSGMLDSLMAEGSDTVASRLDSIRESAETAIEECVEAYELG